MGSVEDDEDALSDFEDDAAPVVLPVSAPAPATAAENLNALLAELESERHARKAAEAAKADLQSTLTRFKNSHQEVCRQRDEAVRHKEEAFGMKEELTRQLKETLQRKDEVTRQRDESIKQRDEAIKEKDEIYRQREEVIKTRDASKAEIETAARLLVSGAEKIAARASKVKSFTGGLPRSSAYTGVAAIAYGFGKRAEEVVDEIVRQHELAAKNRADMREQMEQRNYQIAIEVSQLEASIQHLKNELAEKSTEVEKWQKLTAGKDSRISEIEHEMSEKLGNTTKEMEMFKKTALGAENKIKVLETRMERLKPLLAEIWELIFKANESLVSLSGSFSFQTQTQATIEPAHPSMPGNPEEGIQDCLAAAKALADMSLKIGMTWKEYQELWEKEREDLESTVRRLLREKKEIISLLRSALADRHEALEAVSKTQVDGSHSPVSLQSDTLHRDLAMKNENVQLDSADEDIVLASRIEGLVGDEFKTGEAISMASALENEVKSLRQEIFELRQMLATARAETNWLKVTFESQGKELAEKVARIQELEAREFAITGKIESLTSELAAAEEDISRWKNAATEEAAAGNAVMLDLESCQQEIIAVKQRITQLSQSLEEADNKLRSKEEMAGAAIAARNAAERSLRIADERARDLRERIEEMSRQLEELEGKGELGNHMGWVDLCWPWHWFRGRSNYHPSEPGARAGAEMEELLEPLV